MKPTVGAVNTSGHPGDHGVNRTGNSRPVAPILFPRVFGERHRIIWNPGGVPGKEFYKILPKDADFAVSVAARLNSTLGILQRERIGRVSLAEGGFTFSAGDVRLLVPSKAMSPSKIEHYFYAEANRPTLQITEGRGTFPPAPIKSATAARWTIVVLDVPGLTRGKREAVIELTRPRLEKARIVQP